MRLGYSHHHPDATKDEILKNEVSQLGEEPRILLLESDAGLATTTKFQNTLEAIRKVRPRAIVNIVVGVADKSLVRASKITYAAYPAESNGVRLSELVEKYPKGLSKDGYTKEIIDRMNKLKEHRRNMKMVPH